VALDLAGVPDQDGAMTEAHGAPGRQEHEPI